MNIQFQTYEIMAIFLCISNFIDVQFDGFFYVNVQDRGFTISFVYSL